MTRTLVALGALFAVSLVTPAAIAQAPGTSQAPGTTPPPSPYPGTPQPYPGPPEGTPAPPTTPPTTPEPSVPPATPYGPPPTTPTPPIAPPFAPYPGSPQPAPGPVEPAPPFSATPPPPGYPVAAGVAPGTATTGAMPVPGAKNADDERHDSGLGLEWVWINADVGASYVGLDSLSSSLSLHTQKSSGPAFGAGAGVRLLFFSAGLRARDLQLSNFGDLWEINGEAAFHTRIDHFDPYFGVRGGYAFVGNLSQSAIGAPDGVSPDVTIHGYNAGFIAGCDYYFNHYISLGIDLDPEFLFLQRPKVALPSDLPGPVQTTLEQNPIYKESGTSIGFGFTGTARLGVHL